MVKSLRRSGILQGLNYDQVIAMLGRPDSETLIYYLDTTPSRDPRGWAISVGFRGSEFALGGSEGRGPIAPSSLRELNIRGGDRIQQAVARLKQEGWSLVGKTRGEILERLGPPDIDTVVYQHFYGSLGVELRNGLVARLVGEEYGP